MAYCIWNREEIACHVVMHVQIYYTDLQKEISTLQDQLKVEKCSTAQLNQVIG